MSAPPIDLFASTCRCDVCEAEPYEPCRAPRKAARVRRVAQIWQELGRGAPPESALPSPYHLPRQRCGAKRWERARRAVRT